MSDNTNTKTLEELENIKINICFRMDSYAKRASDILTQINAFRTTGEAMSSIPAIDYLKNRHDEIMEEFKNANDDLIRLKQLIKIFYPAENNTKRVQESAEEFLSRIETEYAYQMFDSTTFDME